MRRNKPSRLVVIGAQVLAYFVTGALVGALYVFLSLAFSFADFPGMDWEMDSWESWASAAALLLGSGVILAAMQLSALRRWLAPRLPDRIKWLALSGLGMAVLALADYWLVRRFLVIPLQASPYWETPSAWKAASDVVWQWSIVGGFTAGLPVGLLFGMAQARLLPWHWRLWWMLSALAWALITALVVGFRNAAYLIGVGLLGG